MGTRRNTGKGAAKPKPKKKLAVRKEVMKDLAPGEDERIRGATGICTSSRLSLGNTKYCNPGGMWGGG